MSGARHLLKTKRLLPRPGKSLQSRPRKNLYDSFKDRISAASTDLAGIDRKIEITRASTRFGMRLISIG